MIRTSLRNLLIRAAGSMRRHSPAAGARVIALHEVDDPRTFRRRLEWLREHHRIVSLGETLGTDDPDSAASRQTAGQTRVALTFDDGYANWIDNAVPALLDLDLPATFFISSGLLGLDGDAWRAFRSGHLQRTRELEPLTTGQLEFLASHPGFEIGGHTCHHVDLGASQEPQKLAGEVRRDRETLEDRTGRRVRWFAYPFGAATNFNDNSREILRQERYEAAWTIIPGFSSAASDRFALPRDALDVDDGEAIWKVRLAGAYDGMYRLKARLT